MGLHLLLSDLNTSKSCLKIFYKIRQDENLWIIQVLSYFRVFLYRSSSYVLVQVALRRSNLQSLERNHLKLCKWLVIFTSFRFSLFFVQLCLSRNHHLNFKFEKILDRYYFIINDQLLLISLNFENFYLLYFLNYQNLQLNEY